jgi:uncharacterized phiE125 gp8 family phage protein
METLLQYEALELVEAPAAMPITLAEVKEQLRIEHADDDVLITRLIAVAVSYTDVTGALGHAMIAQKWAQWFGPNPTQQVRLALGPVTSVTAVKYYDENGDLQTDTLSNYQVTGTGFATYVEPKSGFNWPTTQQRSDAIKIEYQIGYGTSANDVPQGIRHALMMLIGHWYDTRENTMMDELNNVPFGFDALIGMHRRCWYG